MKLRRPCENCPWRVDAPRQYWDPQHFVDIWRNCQDDGMNTMLCHKSNNLPKTTPVLGMPVCQGWIRVMGFDAIGVRIASMFGRVSLEEIADKTSVELFPTFEAMLRANNVSLPNRNRWDYIVKKLATKKPEPQPQDITKGSRWKHHKSKRVVEVVAGFRDEEPVSLYTLDTRRASRDDGDDAYEEMARNKRALSQQVLYRYVKKVGRHVSTCSIAVERFLTTFSPV